MNFLEALSDPNYDFLRYALIMGVFASFAFGVSGSFVVVRRISFIAGSISHAVLGGIGAALYLERAQGISWLSPMMGATVSALMAAGIISWIRFNQAEREDSVIGAVWAAGMSLGLIFISLTPGYIDPMSYLFGNILFIGNRDLVLVLLLDGVLLAGTIFGYRRLEAVCFDEEFARLRGINTRIYYTLLLCLIALSVVLLVSVVGIVLVIALLTIPASMAARHTRTLGPMIALASIFSLVFIVMGTGVSFELDWPTGPTIILVTVAGYFLESLVRRKLPGN